MSIMKVIVVLTMAIVVVMAADSKTADANVVGSMLAAKTRLSAVNVTLNATESANSTVHTMTRRSMIDKSEGKR